MTRTTFVLFASMLVGAVAPAVQAQPVPAKAPSVPTPAPRPAASPKPATRPAPASVPDFPDFPDFIGLRDQLDWADVNLAQIKAGAMADLARQQGELARIQSADLAASARALAEAQIKLNVDAMAMSGLAALSPTVDVAAMPALAKSRGYRTEAPAPWAPQDMADSLYREGRKALSADQYEKAADLFRRIWRVYPQSVYTPDAYYWQAFALQRQGGDRNLGEALASLETQAQKFPKAATLGDARSLRARIEGQLGRRGDQSVATTLRGRAERASDGCPREDEDERIEALNAVMQMDQEQALPILKKVLARREPCTQALRRTAVMLIARNKQAEVAPTLMSVAKNDPDRAVREQAVFWLANLPSDEAVDMLVDLARNGDDLELRKRAVYSLSRSKSAKAQQTLRQLVLDDSQPEELRSDALTWVTSRGGSMDGAQSFAYLKELYGKAGTIAFRQRVLGAMTQLRNDETRAFYVTVALSEREPMDLRRAALSYISSSGRWGTLNGLGRLNTTRTTVVSGQAGSSNASTIASAPASGQASAAAEEAREGLAAAATALGTVYDKATDLEIRRTSLSMLCSLRDNAGVDRLLDIARNEKNTELRRTAVSCLSRTKDPRALQLLQEIINK